MRKLLPILLTVLPLSAAAQLRSGYVDWGVTGPGFGQALFSWHQGDEWSQDDNFFISRVKLHPRFRDASTQVNQELNEENDKNLLFWVPINSPGNNALPDGVWDREVFPMWQYVTHYGNWSTSLIRIPAAFTDAAHKNGVPVSCVAGIPYGNITQGWRDGLQTLIDAGGNRVADYMLRYGVDGIGYNSEFQGPGDLVDGLCELHSQLRERLGDTQCVWYDGTQTSGNISFDKGLTNSNLEIWGYDDDPRTLLFFNYNWNRETLLKSSVKKANTYKRSPLDLYCGFNMQGSEPKSGQRWTLLADYPLSIGLWGAHSENMFWESRGEQGSSPAAKQRAYMERVERWFSSGSRNPVNDIPVTDAMSYNAKNYDFCGMSRFMTARSSLSWDLDEEPFVTCFNLGNGRFFNWEGVRKNDSEWYNLGIQDHLPTWRWWWSTKYLGRTTDLLPAQGLDAEFVWDDAYLGGSSLSIHGDYENLDYPAILHLFKTDFEVKDGDEISITYKFANGNGDVMLAYGNERTEGFGLKLPNEGAVWATKTFVVGKDMFMSRLKFLALSVNKANALDLRLGRVSISRGDKGTPAMPTIKSSNLLHADYTGVDGKVIFNMPNAIEPERTCLNTDVNVSMFQIWSQQEGREPVMTGATSSWAALAFHAPIDVSGEMKMRLGVAAVSMDMRHVSDIAWSDYMDVESLYEINDGISKSSDILHPGQPLRVAFDDPLHPATSWEIRDMAGNTVGNVERGTEIVLEKGLPSVGNYSLTVGEREFPAYIQVIDDRCGNAPEIQDLKLDNVAIASNNMQEAELSYTGIEADGKLSRGLEIANGGIGFPWKETGRSLLQPFSLSFWFRAEDFDNNSLNLLGITDKTDSWPRNAWGWLWHTLTSEGKVGTFVIRGSSKDASYSFGKTVVSPKIWHHFAYVFDFDANKRVIPRFYLDGVEQEVTAWKVGDQEQSLPVTPLGDRYPDRDMNVLSVGGSLHTTGSVRGQLDDLQFYDRAISAAEVAAAMTDQPQEPAGWWTFDNDLNQNGCFDSKGSFEFAAGAVGYDAGKGEGQGIFKWLQPTLGAGCPFLQAGAYDVKTSAQWQILGSGSVIEANGSDTEGFAKFSLPSRDNYAVQLTLSNCYGADSRTITFDGISQILQTDADTAPNVFYNILGQRVATPSHGFYILKNGSTTRKVKF